MREGAAATHHSSASRLPLPLAFAQVAAVLLPLRKCRAVVALVSPGYVVQEGAGLCLTLMQLSTAVQAGMPVVPVRHSGPWPPKGIEIMMGGLDCVPAQVRPQGEVWEEVRKGIHPGP